MIQTKKRQNTMKIQSKNNEKKQGNKSVGVAAQRPKKGVKSGVKRTEKRAENIERVNGAPV